MTAGVPHAAGFRNQRPSRIAHSPSHFVHLVGLRRSLVRFLVFPSGGTASGTHTQMTWNTTDIEAAVAELKARGVVFEEYDTSEVKTINSVATLGQSKGAWFKDSEVNLLALGQFD